MQSVVSRKESRIVGNALGLVLSRATTAVEELVCYSYWLPVANQSYLWIRSQNELKVRLVSWVLGQEAGRAN